jgi:glycerate kinase
MSNGVAVKALIAPCTFKGSLSAREATSAIARGLASAGVECVELPLSDGGEGLVDCFLNLPGSQRIELRVTGPLPGMSVAAAYALLAGGEVAAVEMAAAAGLPLLSAEQRDPMGTTTRGFGEMILDAVRRGAGRLILGIGGSATVDGGAGVASAMGARLLNSRGELLADGGGALRELARIDAAGLKSALCGAEVLVACDVDSPLLGPGGAARVFGPQKGATPEMVEELEKGLARLAERIREDLGRDVAELPGSGAAGGLGAGLVGFLGAELAPGAQLVMDAVGFDDKLEGTDLLVTGEGRLDSQSLRGKAPAAAARRAAGRGVPAVALAGSAELGEEELRAAGMVRAWGLVDLAPAEECMARTAELLEELARRHAAQMREIAES